MTARVYGVARSPVHGFSKRAVDEITLLERLGVEGDAHLGVTVQHLSRVEVDPTQPNLRQVHLIQAELFHELATKGLEVAPAELGENVTTRGIDLLALPRGARLRLGPTAIVVVTGLRNPCAQIERHRPGLLAAVLDRTPEGEVIRKAGIMAIVLAGGTVQPGNPIEIDLPPLPHLPLERV
ncbi:MOSC domain-containing protein [uncultured Sphingomonas sp.]|uniref:MOSC domain-containing protein n=1 Tax=uncultured Sphingomonas sp. TaxID=158754 RepID=UPI0035CB756C